MKVFMVSFFQMSNDIKVDYSRRLRQLRKKHKLTQQKLAELANVEYKHIQRLEGKNPCDIKLSTLEKLAKAFGISISKLLDFK
jgi:transcriptional regulator with XRE-family HTH domain